jgi:signal transduction histidine kinase
MLTPARIYLTAGLAAIGLYFLLPWNSPAQSFVYDAIAASSAVAIVVGVRIRRPQLSVVWYLLATGQLAFAVGDVIFNLYAWVWHTDPPIPSVADLFYLAGYPFLTAGLFILVFRMRSDDRRVGLIDASLLTVAFGICQWVFVMRPLIDSSDRWTNKAVALSYPAMDVLLLAALVFLALTPLRRLPAYWLLTTSVVLLIVADELYALSPDSYAGTSYLDTCWLLSYVLWGVAALTPSMRELTKPRSTRAPSLTNVRLVVLGAAVTTAPVVLVVERLLHRNVDAVAVAVGSALLSTLVLLRLSGLIRSLDGLRRAEKHARGEAENAQRLLVGQNKRLVEADKLKDEFVALISHDLRTPLTSIIGYLELMLDDGNLNEDQRKYLGIADRNAERLLRLVNDLLFVARLEAGELDLHPGELDLVSIVRQSVTEAEPRAAAKQIDLSCEANGPVPVRGDKGRIFQLLDNLVSNAIKFTPEGGDVRVSVGPSNGVARLEVSDTGIGIPAEEQGLLFQRFFRASSANERQIPGTGLGLYISRAIVEAHGGSIAVRSEPGAGTSFCIELPAGTA